MAGLVEEHTIKVTWSLTIRMHLSSLHGEKRLMTIPFGELGQSFSHLRSLLGSLTEFYDATHFFSLSARSNICEFLASVLTFAVEDK